MGVEQVTMTPSVLYKPSYSYVEAPQKEAGKDVGRARLIANMRAPTVSKALLIGLMN